MAQSQPRHSTHKGRHLYLGGQKVGKWAGSILTDGTWGTMALGWVGALPERPYPAIPMRKVLDENQTRPVAKASGVGVGANLMALRPAKTRNLALTRRRWNKAKRTSPKRCCKNRQTQ